MKTIEILVAPSGAVTVETHGFHGSTCREASRFLRSALGRITAETLTAEFHEARPCATEVERQLGSLDDG